MSPAQMREALVKTSRNPGWWQKLDRMSDKQIIAVYYRFLEAGKLNNK